MTQITPYHVRQLEEKDYDGWTRFVAESTSGSPYALPSYLETLCSVTSRQFSIFGVYRGSELVGGVPLYMGRTKAGLVAWDHKLLFYHSPVVRDYVTKYPFERTSRHFSILAAIENHLRCHECDHLALYIRHTITDVRPFLVKGWNVFPNYSYVVNLNDLDHTWSCVGQNLRRLVERAESRGLVHTDDDDFNSFFRLHQETCHRKGRRVYLPEPAFKAFFEKLKMAGLCRLYQVRLPDGRAIASHLVVTGPHPVCHNLCAASDDEYLHMGSSPFLYWTSFKALSKQGYTAIDLSGAPINGVTRFKKQLGGDLVINWWVIRPVTIRFRIRRKALGVVAWTKSGARRMLEHLKPL